MVKKAVPMNLLDLPNPGKWETDGRSFEHTADACKICSHPKRGLIEDLITAGTTGKNIAKWANHYQLFSRPLNEMNVSYHKRHHLAFDLLPVISDADDKEAVAALLKMQDPDRLDLVITKGLVRVLKGSKRPDIKDALAAIKIKHIIPREDVQVERAKLLVERFKKRQAEREAAEKAKIIEGEVVEELNN